LNIELAFNTYSKIKELTKEQRQLIEDGELSADEIPGTVERGVTNPEIRVVVTDDVKKWLPQVLLQVGALVTYLPVAWWTGYSTC